MAGLAEPHHAPPAITTRHGYESVLPVQRSTALQNADESPALDALTHGGLFLLADAYQSLLAQDTEASIPSQPVTAQWGTADGSHACTPPRSLLKGVPAARFIEFADCRLPTAGIFQGSERLHGTTVSHETD